LTVEYLFSRKNQLKLQKSKAMMDQNEALAAVNQRFERAAPQTILRWAVDTYGDQLALVTSFQPSGLVMLHMLLDIAPQIRVLSLDTGLLFPETYGLIETWERQFKLNVTRVRPSSAALRDGVHGPALWERDQDLCCHLRKTAPLGEALRGYSAWITGVRRDQAETRRQTDIIGWDAKYNMVKLAPLATWTERMVWTYIQAYELPYNPLHNQDYTSIGCRPCTRPVAQGEDARAGRWHGMAKTECGIHMPDSKSTKHA
jgi:phosphoadenosine phosphosulfate reductase